MTPLDGDAKSTLRILSTIATATGVYPCIVVIVEESIDWRRDDQRGLPESRARTGRAPGRADTTSWTAATHVPREDPTTLISCRIRYVTWFYGHYRPRGRPRRRRGPQDLKCGILSNNGGITAIYYPPPHLYYSLCYRWAIEWRDLVPYAWPTGPSPRGQVLFMVVPTRRVLYPKRPIIRLCIPYFSYFFQLEHQALKSYVV